MKLRQCALQFLRFSVQFNSRVIHAAHQRRILLRHVVKLNQRLLHLLDAINLLRGCIGNIARQFRDRVDALSNFPDAFSRALSQRRSCLYALRDTGDQRARFLDRVTTTLREASHLGRDNRKATPLLPRTSRFHRGVQSKYISLKRDAFNCANDVSDTPGTFFDQRDSLNKFVHILRAGQCDDSRIARMRACGFGAGRVLLNGCA